MPVTLTVHGLPSPRGSRATSARGEPGHGLPTARLRRTPPSHRLRAARARRRPRRAVRPAAPPRDAADRAARPRHLRQPGPLPRAARRPRRPLLRDAQVPHPPARRRGADRPVPRRGAGTSHGGRADVARTLAEGVAARRDPAAVERAARRHVVRRPAPDPPALLRRARDRATRVLATPRRPPG